MDGKDVRVGQLVEIESGAMKGIRLFVTGKIGDEVYTLSTEPDSGHATLVSGSANFHVVYRMESR